MQTEHSLLRTRVGHEHSRVTNIELFFDLVFVFAVTQLSHALLAHFTLLGAIETLLMLLAVWWVWVYTAWWTNWLDPETLPVRVMLFVLMGIGLLLSASIPQAFEQRGLVFALAYVTMQLSRTTFAVWAFRDTPVQRANFTRILCWLLFAAIFWIIGGLAHDGARLAWWALALAFEYMSPALGFWVPGLGRSTTADWDVEGGHMAERFGLFIIIALGESILVTGATFSTLEWTGTTVAAFVASVVWSIALWWLYFAVSAGVGSQRITASHDPGRLARSVYTYIHLLIVAGIIVSAVADEFVLAHPTGHVEPEVILAVLGSSALFLIGNMLFKYVITGTVPLAYLVALAALAALALVATALTPLLLSIAATLVLVGLAVWATRAHRRAAVDLAQHAAD